MIYHITGLNPEPWVSPEGSIGRKNGKLFVQFYTSDTLRTYQEAVKEEIVLQNGHLVKYPKGTLLAVQFFFWRQLDASESAGRSTRRNVADSTNCQKALEDALQGILYDNDRENHRIGSFIVEQAPLIRPHIAIKTYELSHLDYLDVPPIPTYPSAQRDTNRRPDIHDGDPF